MKHDVVQKDSRSQTSDIWTDAATLLRGATEEKRQKRRIRRKGIKRESDRRDRVKEGRVSRTKVKGREKVEKSKVPCFLNLLRLRRVQSRLAQTWRVQAIWRDETQANCTLLLCEAQFAVKMSRITFGSRERKRERERLD